MHHSSNGLASATDLETAPTVPCSSCDATTEALFVPPFDFEEDRLLTIEEVPPAERTYETEDLLCESCLKPVRRRARRHERRAECSSDLLSFEQVLSQPPPAG